MAASGDRSAVRPRNAGPRRKRRGELASALARIGPERTLAPIAAAEALCGVTRSAASCWTQSRHIASVKALQPNFAFQIEHRARAGQRRPVAAGVEEFA
jgi:hypothetical protein